MLQKADKFCAKLKLRVRLAMLQMVQVCPNLSVNGRHRSPSFTSSTNKKTMLPICHGTCHRRFIWLHFPTNFNSCFTLRNQQILFTDPNLGNSLKFGILDFNLDPQSLSSYSETAPTRSMVNYFNFSKLNQVFY